MIDDRRWAMGDGRWANKREAEAEAEVVVVEVEVVDAREQGLADFRGLIEWWTRRSALRPGAWRKRNEPTVRVRAQKKKRV